MPPFTNYLVIIAAPRRAERYHQAAPNVGLCLASWPPWLGARCSSSNAACSVLRPRAASWAMSFAELQSSCSGACLCGSSRARSRIPRSGRLCGGTYPAVRCGAKHTASLFTRALDLHEAYVIFHGSVKLLGHRHTDLLRDPAEHGFSNDPASGHAVRVYTSQSRRRLTIDERATSGYPHVLVQVLYAHLCEERPKEFVVGPNPIVAQFVEEGLHQSRIGHEPREVVGSQLDVDAHPTVGVVAKEVAPFPALGLHQTVINGVHLSEGAHDELASAHARDHPGIRRQLL
mmetsp:Transcript_4945/g.14576  ORF Transcript_4945/g.14576 Transcript_4945/m.14576 type:complete len:288 (-) Transcript_4945:503-1366(-)